MNQQQALEYIRNRGITTGQVSDAAARDILQDVIRELSMCHGPVTVDTFTTVADQYEYDIPSDALRIVEIYWAPNLSDETVQTYLEELQKGSPLSPHFPSLTVIRNIESNRWRKIFHGAWEVQGNDVILYPTPDAAYTVVRMYRTRWNLVELPERLETLLLDGLQAHATYSAGMKLLGTSGWRASRVRVDSAVGKNLFNEGNRLLREWRHRVGLGKTKSFLRS